MSTLKPVTVTLVTHDGCTHERRYEPHQWAMRSQAEFIAFALGDMFAMITSGYCDSTNPEVWGDTHTMTYCIYDGSNVDSWKVEVH